MCQKKTYEKNGELSSLLLYSYNTQGNLISELDSLSMGKATHDVTEYKYNDKNDLIERSHPYKSYEINSIYKYKYDTHDNWIERIEFIGNSRYSLP